MNEIASLPLVEALKPELLKINGPDEAPQLIALPQGWNAVDLEKFIGKRPPLFMAGLVELFDAPSMVAYLSRYSDSRSVIYVNPRDHSITALLDDGDASIASIALPGRRTHRANLGVQLDPRFVLWLDFCKVSRNQKELIRFIEENDSHFVSPSGADMRTLAAQLDLKKSTIFKSIEKQVGAARDVSLQFETQTNETGEVKFPSELVISVPVFRDQASGQIPVRIHFDLEENRVMFTMRIPDKMAIIDAAWDHLVGVFGKLLADASLSLPILTGAAPAEPSRH